MGPTELRFVHRVESPQEWGVCWRDDPSNPQTRHWLLAWKACTSSSPAPVPSEYVDHGHKKSDNHLSGPGYGLRLRHSPARLQTCKVGFPLPDVTLGVAAPCWSECSRNG